MNKFYGTDILIGESTQQELGDELSTRLVDLVRVKGKKKPVRVYEVLGEKGLSLTQSQEDFARGLSYYRELSFDKAAGIFAASAQSDYLCRIFLERCNHFMTSPPPEGWDGSWQQN